MVSIASACNRIARTRSTQVPSVPLTGDVRGLPGPGPPFRHRSSVHAPWRSCKPSAQVQSLPV
jgi:hypothetical protein